MKTLQNMISQFDSDIIAALSDIHTDDAKAKKLGHALASILCLRLTPHSDGAKYQTQWGAKTDIGIARLVARIIMESSQP